MEQRWGFSRRSPVTQFARCSSSSPQRPPPSRPVNPPDAQNPDPVTLREQWRYATRLYSKWYAHAWATAILAGLGIFAVGWIVKGGNPLPASKVQEETDGDSLKQ